MKNKSMEGSFSTDETSTIIGRSISILSKQGRQKEVFSFLRDLRRIDQYCFHDVMKLFIKHVRH